MAIQILPHVGSAATDEKMLLDPFAGSSPGAVLASAVEALPRRRKNTLSSTNGHANGHSNGHVAVKTSPLANGNGHAKANGHTIVKNGQTNGHVKPLAVPKPSIAAAAKPETEHVNPHWGRFSSGTFLNTLGCGMVVAFCPLLVLLASTSLTHFSGSLQACLTTFLTTSPATFIQLYFPRPSLQVTLGYFGWLAFQAALYMFLPAHICHGQLTPAGYRLDYHVNGLLAWGVTHAAAVILVIAGLLDPAIVAKNWPALVVAFNIYGYMLPVTAYIKALWWPTHAEDRKFSGSWIYDFYMGVELNPRFGSWFDFKLFHNGRPGIVAWTLIDLSFTAYQYQLHGTISNSIIVVNIIHAFYVVDFFINEDWYLRTIDICHDHYGFYLAWGSMVWLPTMYTLQTQYLALHPAHLSTFHFLTLLFVGLSGYTVFRSVNHQKDLSRRTRGLCTIWGKPAEFITARYTTSDGEKHETILLCSGWWGVVRHANYCGDLALSYAACAAAGWSPQGGWALLPWSYALFMTILLIQRCIRDEERCRGKYGKTWEQYCERVPWRLVPGIF